MRQAHRTHGLAIPALAGMPGADTVRAGDGSCPRRAETIRAPVSRARPAAAVSFRGEHMDVTVEPDARGRPRLPRRPAGIDVNDSPEARTLP